MRIAIDTTPLESGHKDRGVGMYTKLLIEALQKYGSKHSYHFFTRVQKIPNDIELIHYPYFDPFFVTLPFFYQKPTVITIHDLIPLVFPEHFPAGIRGAMKWQYQRVKLMQAARVMTDSESSMRDIERIVDIPQSRIDVVHLAPSPEFVQVHNTSLLSSVKAKYGLPDRFILYVGDVNWNKNILGMLEAYQSVKRQASSVKLVLVGKAFLDTSLRETQQINLFQADAVRVGGVPLEDLVAIYSLASVYIQPSYYEGFGLPVLEAMACGTPVVSSRAASLAEIAGPAIAVNPSDPKDIARGILEALTMTPVKRNTLIYAQTKWVQQFSWERVAHQVIESYEKAIRRESSFQNARFRVKPGMTRQAALNDFFIIGGIFVIWRSALLVLEKIAPLLWPLREGFLGQLSPWANFDGAHYTSIAKAGYGGYQTAFFPLYPLLIRFLTFVTKLPHEYIAVIISHIAFLIGLFLFWRYLERTRGRVWTMVFFLLYPTSFFFAAGYSESVFFALAAGALLAIKRKQWLIAGILAGFASATRLIGVFLLFPLAYAIWQERRRLLISHWVALILAPAGLFGYMVYLWESVGDPLAFFHVQSAFGAGRSGGELIFLPQVLWRYAMILSTVPTGELLYHVAVLEIFSFVLGLILLLAAWRKRYDPALLLYSACVLALPTLTGTLSSMPRYVLAAFPLFSVLGGLRSIWVKILILIVFFTILVYAATGFLRGYFIS